MTLVSSLEPAGGASPSSNRIAASTPDAAPCATAAGAARRAARSRTSPPSVGEKLVYNLRQDDHRVLVACPSYGVDAVTGRGLDWALADAQVVVDCSNPPDLGGDAPLRFFETAGLRLTAAERAAGVQHHIAISIVGVDRLGATGYFRAKRLQEDLVEGSGLPYSILRSTQFFEYEAEAFVG